MNDVTPGHVYELYEVEGREPAEIAEELDITLARVHVLIASYLRRESLDSMDYGDKDYKREAVEPMEDIDVMHPVSYLRMERMSSDTVFLAGYNARDSDPDHRFDLVSTDNGLKIDYTYVPGETDDD